MFIALQIYLSFNFITATLFTNVRSVFTITFLDNNPFIVVFQSNIEKFPQLIPKKNPIHSINRKQKSFINQFMFKLKKKNSHIRNRISPTKHQYTFLFRKRQSQAIKPFRVWFVNQRLTIIKKYIVSNKARLMSTLWGEIFYIGIESF